MSTSINGFYAAYLTGNGGQGLAMVIFRNGKIVGVDVGGAKYDGIYSGADKGFAMKISISFPANTPLVQGGTTGIDEDNSVLDFHLPTDFLSQPFIRVNAKHGPVNVKLVKLRELND